MKNFGICTAGTEEQFEAALRELANPGQPFVYCEIGVAHCETWRAVCEILSETGALWRTIGIDPWIYAFEAYQKGIEPLYGIDRALMLVQTREEAFATEMERIGPRLDFVFIDGCHGKPCAIGDFLAVESLVVPGGLVVFHDFGPDSQGTEMQTHCLQPVGVREATADLRLLQDMRPGWSRLPDWVGDKSRNGATCGCFQRL